MLADMTVSLADLEVRDNGTQSQARQLHSVHGEGIVQREKRGFDRANMVLGMVSSEDQLLDDNHGIRIKQGAEPSG